MEDKLTGLLRSDVFVEKAINLMRVISRSDGSNRYISVIVADMVGLKKINESGEGGHAKGDEALKLAAEIFTRAFRVTDLISRWHDRGDEFIVFLPLTDEEGGAGLIARLSEELDRKGVSFRFGISSAACPLTKINEKSCREYLASLAREADEKLISQKNISKKKPRKRSAS